LNELDNELGAFRRAIENERAGCKLQLKKFTVEDREMGRDDNARRVCLHVTQWSEMEADYTAYVQAMRRLVSLHPETFAPAKLKIEEVIPKQAMGQRNSIYDLQNYIIGLGAAGLALNSDGSLDVEHSFVRINYFDLLKRQTVRNNVQPEISNEPVDFLATRLPREAVAAALPDNLRPDDDPVWLYAGPERQALVLARREASGQLQLRYLPIARLTQNANGTLQFDRIEWTADLPLRMFEDARLETPNGDRLIWLNDWHSDGEWLRALYKTKYSNGLIGLHEQFTQFVAPATDADALGISDDERLLRMLRRRQRRLTETDLQIFANNHWNFDVRGFNPGGNHGSFLRVSSHATFMLAGGEHSGIPRGLAVTEPYDSLSVVPTILALIGELQPNNSPVDALAKRGFVKFPGRVVTEIAGPHFAGHTTSAQ